MTLRTGKILTAEVFYDADTDHWSGAIEFDGELMPMEIGDGIRALAALGAHVKNTAARMIQEAETNFAIDEAMGKPPQGSKPS